jgi:6-methylsalicylate decarboxylase
VKFAQWTPAQSIEEMDRTGVSMAALAKFVPMSQILFGSDYPYWPISYDLDALLALGLSTQDLAAIQRENALRLFPQYRPQ